MKFRMGLWVVALALVAWIVLVGVDTIVFQIHRLDPHADRDEAFAHAVRLPGLMLAAAVALGAFACARGTRGDARAWLHVTAAASALHVVIAIAGRYAGPLAAIVDRAWACAPAFFALAMLGLQRGRRLAFVLVGMLALELLAGVVLAHDFDRVRVLDGVPMASYIVWAFLVLDVLDAFPAHGPLPSVSVATRARTVASAVSAAALVIGFVVIVVAVWTACTFGTLALVFDVSVGFVAFLAGILGQWRLRGRTVPTRVVAAVVGTFIVAAPLALHCTIPGRGDVELVELDAIPSMVIALPDGPVDVIDAERGHGAVEARPWDRRFPRIELIWPFPSSSFKDDVVFEVGGREFRAQLDRALMSWRCSPDGPNIVLEISMSDPAAAERLLRRIAASVRCR